MACAPQEQRVHYLAIGEAMADVKEGRTVPVPVSPQGQQRAKSLAEMSAGGREGLAARRRLTGAGGAAEAIQVRPRRAGRYWGRRDLLWAWTSSTTGRRTGERRSC